MSGRDKNRNHSSGGRFQKGVSGNPKGRPKKATGRAEKEHPFIQLAESSHLTTVNGSESQTKTNELLQFKIYNEALKGDLKAIRRVLGWVKKRVEYFEKQKWKNKSAPLELSIEVTDPRNADAALETLGIIFPRRDGLYGDDETLVGQESDYTEYVMAPWVVQSALSRNRGKELISQQDLDWALAYTDNASSIKVPRRYRNAR